MTHWRRLKHNLEVAAWCLLDVKTGIEAIVYMKGEKTFQVHVWVRFSGCVWSSVFNSQESARSAAETFVFDFICKEPTFALSRPVEQ